MTTTKATTLTTQVSSSICQIGIYIFHSFVIISDTNPEPDESDSEDIITVEDNFDTNKQEPKPVHQIPTLLNPAVTAIFDEFKATKFTSPPVIIFWMQI